MGNILVAPGPTHKRLRILLMVITADGAATITSTQTDSIGNILIADIPDVRTTRDRTVTLTTATATITAEDPRRAIIHITKTGRGDRVHMPGDILSNHRTQASKTGMPRMGTRKTATTNHRTISLWHHPPVPAALPINGPIQPTRVQ